MNELSIKCQDCGKIVYGQDWLSGGMCGKCNIQHELKIEKLREEQAKNSVFIPYNICNCDKCKEYFKNINNA